MPSLIIGWTTVETQEDAQRLAREAVEQHLAACVQIDAPITSVYSWQGQIEQSQEYRLTFKLPQHKAEALEEWLLKAHPYDTPEWIAIQSTHVSQAYLKWAIDLQ